MYRRSEPSPNGTVIPPLYHGDAMFSDVLSFPGKSGEEEDASRKSKETPALQKEPCRGRVAPAKEDEKAPRKGPGERDPSSFGGAEWVLWLLIFSLFPGGKTPGKEEDGDDLLFLLLLLFAVGG